MKNENGEEQNVVVFKSSKSTRRNIRQMLDVCDWDSDEDLDKIYDADRR